MHSLRRSELGLVVGVRRVLLADELRDELLDLVVVVQVLPDLVHEVLVDETVEGVGKLVVYVFLVLALFEGHVRLQVAVSQLEQLVVLLELALVFLEQLVVQILVVHGSIVHGNVQAD